MGGHESWSQLNGLLANEADNVHRVLDAERWSRAEERTAELIACIQPNRASEEHRTAVAKYVRRLIMKCFSCEVFTYGSVPLKTYLMDGDIDFTAFSMSKDLKDTWVNAVLKVLENEEKNVNAEFRVKEVQYIPAEVKIIKCHVENMIVDISFGQVGGLCTLCFLDEVDHMISQNHLFKRSIVLIKAWCYYESRILGAYHGLISTYALEILVLYIFHVFNNTFTGPLEVLYRFLEFFSKFDWDNFCVSLWGPVPISSLPDMTAAELPRKDGGKLVFDKLFFEACCTIYDVSLGSQENQGQQFVSKYFNVIDPLRTNNNLGRSVNKGNFYRILSAFALGAKKLANLFDCPQENLIAEVDQFFMNTWERHRSCNRPDALISSIRNLQPLTNYPNESPNNSSTTTNLKKENGSIGLQVSHEHQAEGGPASRGYASHVLNTITKQAQRTHGTSLERNATSSISIQSEKNQKNSRPDHSAINNEGKSRPQLSRTQSSPELIVTVTDALSQIKHNIIVKTSKTHNEHLTSEYSSRRKIMDSEVPTVQSARFSFDDPEFSRQSSSHQSLEVAADSGIISNSHLDDSGSTTMRAEVAFDSEALELQQLEEQDLINEMASSGNHNLTGQVQLPMHLASHLPLPLSPALASMGYAHRNWTGIVPSNYALIDASWGSGMQFIPGFGSSSLPYYCTNATQNSNSEETDSVNENSGKTSLEDGENDVWHDHDAGSIGGFETENEGLKTYSDERQHFTASKINYTPTSRGNVLNTSVTRGNHKVATRSRGHRNDYPDAFQYQTGRANDVSATNRNANLRFVPTTQSSSFRRKYSSEASRDVVNSRVTKTARDNWGRKPSLSVVTNSFSGKARRGRQFEGALEHNSSSRVDDENLDCFPSLSAADTYMEDLTLGSVPLASPPVKNQLTGSDAAQISAAHTSTSVVPEVVRFSDQKMVHNSGVPPSAFYPMVPLFPFVDMLPVYNFPADGANSDDSINQFDEDSGEQNCRFPSHQNIDIVEQYNQSEGRMNPVDLSTTRAGDVDFSEELETDILNSDFDSHLQSLQYGRLCQNTPNHRPFVYSPFVMVPPIYMQGHYPLDGPVGPPIANINPRMAPFTSLQPGPSRPSSGYYRYENERQRFRAGTGTYLPNQRSSLRGRHFSNKRNHRGGYNYDRSVKKDTEGSWINSKAQSGSLPARIDTTGRIIHDQRPTQRRTNDQRNGAYRGGSTLSSAEKSSSPHSTRKH